MTREARKDDEADYLYDALSDYLEHVKAAYQQHEDKRLVMLFDIKKNASTPTVTKASRASFRQETK